MAVNLLDYRGRDSRPSGILINQAINMGIWTDRTILYYAEKLVEAHPDRIIFVDNENEISAKTIFDSARRVATYFKKIGVNPGDVISFQLPNWWEASVINLATVMVGGVVNPILPINRSAELRYIIGDIAPKAIFIPENFRSINYREMLENALGENNSLNVICVRSKSYDNSLESIISDNDPTQDFCNVDPNSVKLAMYTSGTTGRPKAVLHSHNTINADTAKMVPALGLEPGGSLYTASPITHVTGYLYVLNVPWFANITAVTNDVWDPARASKNIQKYQCQFMAGATPFLRDISILLNKIGDSLPSLTNFLCGGASVPPQLIYDAQTVLPNCLIWRNYGSTEAPTLTRNPENFADAHLGAETDGKIYRADIKLVDLVTGEPTVPGEEGAIYAREPSMALGYLNPQDEVDAYDEEGFFKMGDLGRIVHGDHLVITGRVKDIIVRAGENISAREIEDVLSASPMIVEAAVVSMPNERTGEIACAFVVPAEGAEITIDTMADLISAAGLAKQKTPEHVVSVPLLPKTASGKVLKDELRAQARLIAEGAGGHRA